MTPPRPVFDADSLALFLQAHVMRAGALATSRPPGERDAARRNGERGEKARLRQEARVSKDVFELAYHARAGVLPEHRRRLWLAMGIDPDIDDMGADR